MGADHRSPAPELVPCRVGVAYVSIRVTLQSTARTVVQEVLPLLGCQVCAGPTLPGVAALGGSLGVGGLSRPHTENFTPQDEGPESFQLVEALMGSRQGEWAACSQCAHQLCPRGPVAPGHLFLEVATVPGANGWCLSTPQSSARCWRLKSPCLTGFMISGRSVDVGTGPWGAAGLWPWPLPRRERVCP